MSNTVPRTASTGLPAHLNCEQRRNLPLHAVRQERSQNHSLHVLLLGGAILLGGCASLQEDTSSTPDVVATRTVVSATDEAMANDMVGVATQIFNPIETTLQFNANDTDALLAHFIEEFAEAGYGIQRVSADQGSHYFTYSINDLSPTDSDTGVRFDTSIGAVDLSRDYTLAGSRAVSPNSPFRLSGTREPVEVMDEAAEAFNPATDEFSSVVYLAALNLDEQAPPVISLITNDIVNRVANETTQSASLQALNSSRVEVSNLFYSDQSNFTSVLDNYKQIDRQVVVFGDDSLVLGNTNKSLIKQWVDQRLQPDDLVSLVGCSNGPTALDIGNEGLALGRANRVTQALLEEGVPRDRILDEGCWAPVSAGDKFPSRGVVLELWREV